MILNFKNKYNIGDEVVIKQANPPKPNTGWFPDDEGNCVLRVIRYKITDIKVSAKTLEPTYCLDVIDEDWQPEWCNYAFVKEDEIICLAKDFNLLEYKAKEIAEYLNQPNGSNSLLQCHQAAMIMAEWKDEQLKNHEQSLLWTFESILDKIVPDGESYNIAINEFKNQLINKL